MSITLSVPNTVSVCMEGKLDVVEVDRIVGGNVSEFMAVMTLSEGSLDEVSRALEKALMKCGSASVYY